MSKSFPGREAIQAMIGDIASEVKQRTSPRDVQDIITDIRSNAAEFKANNDQLSMELNGNIVALNINSPATKKLEVGKLKSLESTMTPIESTPEFLAIIDGVFFILTQIYVEYRGTKINTYIGAKSIDGGHEFTVIDMDTSVKWKSVVRCGRYIVFISREGKIRRTSDYGYTWEDITVEPFSSIYRTYVFGDVIYCAGGSTNAATIWRSTDFGSTWEQVTTTAPSAYFMGTEDLLVVDPNTLILPSAKDIYYSTDHGATWSTSGQWPAQTFGYTAVIRNGRLYCANHTGVFESSDLGATWVEHPIEGIDFCTKVTNVLAKCRYYNMTYVEELDELVIGAVDYDATNKMIFIHGTPESGWVIDKSYIDTAVSGITKTIMPNIMFDGNRLIVWKSSLISSTVDECGDLMTIDGHRVVSALYSAIRASKNPKSMSIYGSVGGDFTDIGNWYTVYKRTFNSKTSMFSNNPLWDGSNTQSIACYDNTVVALFDSQIGVSHDLGHTWKRAEYPSTSHAFAVWSVTNGVFLVADTNNNIYVSYDYGDTWTLFTTISMETAGRINSICVYWFPEIVAFCKNGMFTLSADGTKWNEKFDKSTGANIPIVDAQAMTMIPRQGIAYLEGWIVYVPGTRTLYQATNQTSAYPLCTFTEDEIDENVSGMMFITNPGSVTEGRLIICGKNRISIMKNIKRASKGTGGGVANYSFEIVEREIVVIDVPATSSGKIMRHFTMKPLITPNQRALIFTLYQDDDDSTKSVYDSSAFVYVTINDDNTVTYDKIYISLNPATQTGSGTTAKYEYRIPGFIEHNGLIYLQDGAGTIHLCKEIDVKINDALGNDITDIIRTALL